MEQEIREVIDSYIDETSKLSRQFQMGVISYTEMSKKGVDLLQTCQENVFNIAWNHIFTTKITGS